MVRPGAILFCKNVTNGSWSMYPYIEASSECESVVVKAKAPIIIKLQVDILSFES